MPHAWESNVVGGVMAPRFVLCNSEDFITNGEFEVNGSGWGIYSSQSADPLTPFGDYSLRTGAGNALEQSISPGLGALGGQTFALSMFARGTGEETVTISATSPAEEHTLVLSDLSPDEFRPRAEAFSWASNQTDTSFTIACTVVSDLYIDRVHCYEVTHDIDSMPAPAEDSYEFPQQLQARTVRADMTIIDYVLGWRFLAELKYDFMTAQHEVWRTRISEAGLVIFWPHTDDYFVTTCLWDAKRYRRRYFHNRYLGYVGTIELIGVDLLSGKPVRIVS